MPNMTDRNVSGNNLVNKLMQAIYCLTATTTYTPGAGGGSAFAVTPPFFWRLMTPIFKRMPGKVVVAVRVAMSVPPSIENRSLLHPIGHPKSPRSNPRHVPYSRPAAVRGGKSNGSLSLTCCRSDY